MSHWAFNREFDPADWWGFVYRITDLDTQREYIGKKAFWSVRRLRVSGKKNRRVVKGESDWREYTGSCTALNSQIALRGKDRFHFQILSLHETKASLSYREIELQITLDVLRALLPSGQRRYYNGWISSNVKYLPPLPTLRELEYRD
jgi:hypothetical protein